MLALAGILFLGLVNLIYPFTGDQALFVTGAHQLERGAVLYRDFWDLKQPGIYWFYEIVGRLFGYSEAGIHFGELLYFACLAAALLLATRRYFRSSAMTPLAAILTVGVYFAVCKPYHLTQVEGLVAFPLFLCLWLTLPGEDGRGNTPLRFFCAGVMAGIVALFKLILILLPIAFVLLAIFPLLLRREKKPLIFSILLSACAGVALVFAPVAIYFWTEGQLGLIYKTFFVYPPRVVSELPGFGIGVLYAGLRWFVFAAVPLLPFAAWGAFIKLRRGWDAMTLGLLGWLLLGFAVVLAQRMWWQYHFLLPLFPVGLLAAAGFEDILARKPFGSRLARGLMLLICCGFLFGPYLLRWSIKVNDEIHHAYPFTADRREQFRERLNPLYVSAKMQAAALDATGATPGDIYVMGNPIIYYLSGQTQGVAINGWALEWLLPDQWQELANQLATKHPNYVFLGVEYNEIVDQRGSAVRSMLAQHYRKLTANAGGVWYAFISLPH